MTSVSRVVLRALAVIVVVSLLVGCRDLVAEAPTGAGEVVAEESPGRGEGTARAPRATREVALSDSPFGVFYGLTTYRSRPTTDYMVELGADWTRQTLPWKSVQPQRNQFKWGAVDGTVAMVDAAERGGHPINILATVRTHSPWAAARRTTRGPQAATPPADLQDYYRFVRATVERARGRVRYWQIDNEVDSLFFWEGSAEEYLQVLRTASRAIKDADPEAKVVLAGIQLWWRPMIEDEIAAGRGQRAVDLYSKWAENNDQAKGAPRPSAPADLTRMWSRGKAGTVGKRQADFVRRLFQKETAQYFDVVDIHVYHPYPLIPAVVEWAQAVMAKEGYSKPIWITETSGPNYPELWLSDTVGERRQAEEVVKRYVLSLASGVERVFWYVLATPQHQEKGEWSRTGLLRSDLSKRPAYHTYRLMTGLLQGARSVRTLELGSGISAFEFTRPQGSVYVLWADKGVTTRLPIGPCRLEIVDALGKRTRREVTERQFEFSLSSTPVFVRPEAARVGLQSPRPSSDRGDGAGQGVGRYAFLRGDNSDPAARRGQHQVVAE